MNILVPESGENHKEMQTNCLNTFIQKIMENFLQPKENSEEYKRLKEFLGNDFEKYSKHWTIKRAKTAKIIIEKRILNRDGILKGQCMDKWNKNSIETAKKLKDIGMEIKPIDWIYMWHRTPERIEKLKKYKEYTGTLGYTYNAPYGQGTIEDAFSPRNWDRFVQKANQLKL